MSCLVYLLPVLVWLIVFVAVLAIARIILAYVALPPIMAQIINIVFWAIIAIAGLYIAFDLLSCVVSLRRF